MTIGHHVGSKVAAIGAAKRDRAAVTMAPLRTDDADP